MANTIAEINKEIYARAKEFGLDIDCGADGAFGARVAIIAEAPGERERTLKMPLSGGSGKLLWDTLRPYGLNRRNCYVTNVVKKQLLTLGDGKYEKTVIAEGEEAQYRSILDWELAQLPNLEYIVVLGTTALRAITGYTSIIMYRGSVMDVQLEHPTMGTKRQVKVLAMLNPAAVLRNPKDELMFKFDCSRLNDLVNGQFEEYVVKARINPSFDEAMAWIDKMENDGLPVSFDIETSSGEMICCGFANDPHEGMCINFRTGEDNRWTIEEEKQLLMRIARFLQSPSVRLVMQNGMYDSSWMWFLERLQTTTAWFDTMLAHHTLFPSMPHSLAFMTTQYTTHPYYKDEGKTWKDGGSIDAEWVYNVKDCCITLKAAQEMMKELEQTGLKDFFFEHVMPLHRELVPMSVLGVKIDLAKRHELAVKMRQEIEQLRGEFQTAVNLATGLTDYSPNPASPKQMQDLYFNKLKLVGRGVKTDAENRQRMRNHPKTSGRAVALLDAVDKLAKASKFYSTYVDTTLDMDGKMRTTYRQTGVQSAPGRLSSAETGWNTGGNQQNLPDAANVMFIAEDGYEWSYFDMAQAEARVVGWRYVIPQWIEDFERARTEATGFDAHRSLAATMFNTEYDLVPTYDIDQVSGQHTIRYIAKRCRHGLNYRMMADRLATTLGVPFAEAERLWFLYHKVNPELQIGWQHDVDMIRNKRFMDNAYGRRWSLLERFSDEALEAIVAFYHQSTIGDHVTRVIRMAHNDKDWPRGEARIARNVHDALYALNRPQDGEAVRAVLKKHAEHPIPIKGVDGRVRELIIPSDFKVSVPDDTGLHRWSNMKKVAM